jgi:hypothetical protein
MFIVHWKLFRVIKLLLWILISNHVFVCAAYARSPDLVTTELILEFQKTVPKSLKLPEDVLSTYIQSLNDRFRESDVNINSPEYVVLIDRNPHVQIGMILLGSQQAEGEGWQLIGAAPISTGRPGSFDHFLTPLGVFKHSLENLDFRAEGTKNDLGFRGYGVKGMRVYDFGWVNQYQGWGKKKMSVMRLQMHTTDPDYAEHLLGTPKSKGCIRIPAAMNQLIDRYGLLDAEYDDAIKRGEKFWVLRKDRVPAATPGRYLVVVDSGLNKRPSWAMIPQRTK